jgi:hypothetical protein
VQEIFDLKKAGPRAKKDHPIGGLCCFSFNELPLGT